MKRLLSYSLIIACSTLLLVGGLVSPVGAKGLEPVKIGTVVPEFKAVDLSGTERTLSSLKGKNGTVLIFIAVECPISNAYNERMEKLAEDYRAKGVNVVGINSNATEPMSAVKNHASQQKFTFTIVKDAGNRIADQLGAEHTPEAYLLDSTGKLVYHGRIDNQKNASMVSANDLRDAIDAVLEGKPVAKPTALAFGCSIKRA